MYIKTVAELKKKNIITFEFFLTSSLYKLISNTGLSDWNASWGKGMEVQILSIFPDLYCLLTITEWLCENCNIMQLKQDEKNANLK